MILEDAASQIVSVLIPVRDRYDYRIINLLNSLKFQTYPKELIEIILLDCGSDKSFVPKFNEIRDRFQIKGIQLESHGWNKSYALNRGIESTSGKYILVSDVDMIFEKNYIAACIEIITSNSLQALYCCSMDSPEGSIVGEIDLAKDYNELKKACSPRVGAPGFPYGVGILFAPKELVLRVNGYDEFYKLWGFEDIDIVRRLQALGVVLTEISDRTSYIHQWHAKYEGVKDKNEFEGSLERNKKYFKLKEANINLKRDYEHCKVERNKFKAEITRIHSLKGYKVLQFLYKIYNLIFRK